MNLCGGSKDNSVYSVLYCQDRGAVQSQAPPSPKTSSIQPPDLQATPVSTVSRVRDVFPGASPSPSLLNPLSKDYWSESSSRHLILCPRLETASINNALIQRLEVGIRMTLHDGESLAGKAVQICLSNRRTTLRIFIVANMPSDAGEEEAGDEKTEDIQDIPISDVVKLELGKIASSALNKEMFDGVHPSSCFSMISKGARGEAFQLDFEAASARDRDEVVSALLGVLDESEFSISASAGTPCLLPSRSLLPRKSPCNSFLPTSSLRERTIADTQPLHASVMLSPLRRTRIHAGITNNSELRRDIEKSPKDEGTELSLVDQKGMIDALETIDIGPPVLRNRITGSNLDAEAEGLGGRCGIVTSVVMEKRRTSNEVVDAVITPTESLVTEYVVNPSAVQWCASAACTLDLKDITESFNSIFQSMETQARREDESSNVNSADGDDAFSNVVPTDMEALESYMTNVLGDPSSMLSFFSDDLWSGTGQVDESAVEPAVNSRIRNRSGVFNAQASRWIKLQNEMTFAPVSHSASRKMHFIETTKSMDALDCLIQSADVQRQAPRLHSTEASSGATFGFFDTVVANLVIDASNPSEEDVLFYDSDPENVRLRTAHRGPRRVVAERTNKVDVDEIMVRNNVQYHFRAFERRGAGISESQVKEIVEIMKTEQMNFLLHPQPNAVSQSRPPLCVTVWIERGTYLMNQSFIQPKLMWKPTYESRLESRKINIGIEGPERIDLLEVCRIQESPKIDRRIHPFAIERKCFSVETQKVVLLFQAQSVREKNRIVFGMKLCVARLASLLMVRDMRAIEEFFEPIEAEVPGQAPGWTKGNQNES